MRSEEANEKQYNVAHYQNYFLFSPGSPFRALHNCLCKKRLRKNLLPTKFVNEEDKIKAQRHDIQEMVGFLSPDSSGEVQIVDYKQACFQENNEYY